MEHTAETGEQVNEAVQIADAQLYPQQLMSKEKQPARGNRQQIKSIFTFYINLSMH